MGELRRHVDADLATCQRNLDEEATADAQARGTYGDDWRVPQSATLAKHLWEKLHSYRYEAHTSLATLGAANLVQQIKS